MNNIDVVISGGSMDGICGATGFLKAITEDLRMNIVSAAGASAGGIILGAYAAGHSASEIEEIILKTKFSDFIRIPKWYNIISILSAIKNQYISDGTKLYDAFNKIVYGKTFSEIRIDLHIAGTDITRKYVRDFNRATDPNMPVALAMQITCTIPGCFKPVKYDGVTWYDGSIRSHYPVELVPNSERPFYGFLASHAESIETPMRSMNGIYGFIMTLIDNTLDMNVRYSTNLSKRQPITVKYDYSQNRGWRVSRSERAKLIELARVATLRRILDNQ
ncbi:MAG: patatin-like phospholipase family protein [Nitrososphaerales archaeon]